MNDLAQSLKPIPTGWPKLDKVLGGGLLPGLYVIGAGSSMGKSTFMLQMADSIAQNGRTVLSFSLEMPPLAIGSKILARRVFDGLPGKHKGVRPDELVTAQELMVRGTEGFHGRLRERITQAQLDMARIKDLLVYTPSPKARLMTAEAICQIISQRTAANRERQRPAPVAVVDYLQILPPPYQNCRPAEAIDTALKCFREVAEAVPVILISALNREAFGKPVEMDSFQDTSSIEYSADVLMGLEFPRDDSPPAARSDAAIWVDKHRRALPRTVDLSIVKQRYGQSSVQVPFWYYPPCVSAAPVQSMNLGLKVNNTEICRALRYCSPGQKLYTHPLPQSPDVETSLRVDLPPDTPPLDYWDLMVADAVFTHYQELDCADELNARRETQKIQAQDEHFWATPDPRPFEGAFLDVFPKIEPFGSREIIYYYFYDWNNPDLERRFSLSRQLSESRASIPYFHMPLYEYARRIRQLVTLS